MFQMLVLSMHARKQRTRFCTVQGDRVNKSYLKRFPQSAPTLNVISYQGPRLMESDSHRQVESRLILMTTEYHFLLDCHWNRVYYLGLRNKCTVQFSKCLNSQSEIGMYHGTSVQVPSSLKHSINCTHTLPI